MEFDGYSFQQMENILLWDNDDDDDFIIICAAVAVAMNSSKIRRANFYIRDRIEWKEHVEELMAEGDDKFTRIYRMEYSSFQNYAVFWIQS